MVLFFLTSRENAAGPKGQAFKASHWHEETQVSSGHPKGRVMRTWQSPYEICTHWRRLRRGWSPVPAVGLFYSARTVSSPSPACQALDNKSWWGAKSLLASVVLPHKGWLRRSISTVDRFGFGMRAHRQSISTDFFLVWIHTDGLFRLIFG